MKIAKKLLVSGLSLALMSSVGLQSVSAHHVNAHRHYRISQVMKRSHRKHSSTIKLGSTLYSNSKIYSMIYKGLRFEYNYLPKTNKENRMYINKNKKFSRVLKRYWNSLAPIQQRKLVQLGSPWSNSGADYKFFDKINSQVNHSQYGLSQEANQHSKFLNQIRTRLIQDINQSRIQYGEEPLKTTTIMQQASNHEVKWTQYAYEHINNYLNYSHNTSNPSDNWVHGNSVHNSVNDFMHSHNYNILSSDNASTWDIGAGRQADGTPQPYNNDNPQGIADNINDDLMNHDMAQGNNNGHREIELNPSNKYLGVSVSYNPQTNLGSVDEGFGYNMDFE